jgi:tRNA nucleotidyltransferase (CCA-adding enzyme)
MWRGVMPETTGDTLRAMGIAPGPWYRRILSALRSGWLDGTITSAAEEQNALRQLISNLPADVRQSTAGNGADRKE